MPLYFRKLYFTNTIQMAFNIIWKLSDVSMFAFMNQTNTEEFPFRL